MAESTKELTEEGAKVTTFAEGAEATAAPPVEPGATMDDADEHEKDVGKQCRYTSYSLSSTTR